MGEVVVAMGRRGCVWRVLGGGWGGDGVRRDCSRRRITNRQHSTCQCEPAALQPAYFPSVPVRVWVKAMARCTRLVRHVAG